jgi:hypothetical protein
VTLVFQAQWIASGLETKLIITDGFSPISECDLNFYYELTLYSYYHLINNASLRIFSLYQLFGLYLYFSNERKYSVLINLYRHSFERFFFRSNPSFLSKCILYERDAALFLLWWQFLDYKLGLKCDNNLACRGNSLSKDLIFFVSIVGFSTWFCMK